MEVIFYSGFTKRPNSTKRPSDGTKKNVVLKEETSMRSPTFQMSDDGVGYDYCSCGTWYYYISNKRYYPDGMIEYDCTLDLLATNKSAINGFNCYIERCSQGNPDLLITDPMNKPTNTIRHAITTMMDVMAKQGGYYLLLIASNIGPVGFLMTHQQVRSLFDAIMVHDWNDAAVNKAMEYVIGLKQVPYYSGDGTTEIVIGSFSSGITAQYITLTSDKLSDGNTYTLNMPSHDITGIQSYLDYSPYTIGSIYLPYVGVVPLDLDILASDHKLKVNWTCDRMTGDIIYQIAGTNSKFATYSGNCSSDIPISQAVNNVWGARQALVEYWGGGISQMTSGITSRTASGVLAGLSGVVNNALSYCQAKDMHGQINGSMSSNLGAYTGNTVTAYLHLSDPANKEITSYNKVCGMPFQKVGTVADVSGSHGGYVQTYGCSLTGCAFDTNATTSALVDAGIFLE